MNATPMRQKAEHPPRVKTQSVEAGVASRPPKPDGSNVSVLPVDKKTRMQGRKPVGKTVGKSDRQLEELLLFEAKLRQVSSIAELQYFLVNEAGSLVGAKQVFIEGPANRKNERAIKTASSITFVDRDAPFIRWLERELATAKSREMTDQTAFSKAQSFRIRASGAPSGIYPYSYVLELPIVWQTGEQDELDFGSLCFLNDREYSEREKSVAERIQQTIAHAWNAFPGSRKLLGRLPFRKISLLVACLMFGAGWIPVPMTVLAPAEIVPKNPVVMAAPLNGVVELVHIRPGQQVRAGDKLFSYVKSDFENEAEVARQKMLVAAAQYNRARQQAFGNADDRRDLAVSKVELALAKAEYQFAKSSLERSDVFAPEDGLAMFSDVNYWTGRPVSTGEKVIRLADPDNVLVEVELSVSDAIVLERSASVKVFLDSAPLNAFNAEVISYNYAAERNDRDTLSYQLKAELAAIQESDIKPTIGMRGTAQVYGDEVSLAFFLFRKPISVFRQYFGW